MRVAKLNKDAIIPTRKHLGDAGFDLYCYDDKVKLQSKEFTIVGTGITIEIPKSTVGLILPKSGTDFLIGAGVIDPTYQGEILVKIFNGAPFEFRLKKGDKIAQIVFVNLTGGDNWDLEEVSLDQIHQVKSLRADTGGIHIVKSTPEILGEGTINVNEKGEIEIRKWD